MLRVGKIMQYQIVNPKIFHNKLEIKRDSNLSFVQLMRYLVPIGRIQINKTWRNETEQTRQQQCKFDGKIR